MESQNERSDVKQEYPNEAWILAATILASSMAFIDGSALNVALPVIQTSLHASGAQLLWVVNAYLLMLAALILVGGSLGDRFGRKRVFMLGITLFGFASLACGLSPTIEWMIGARIIQGIGGAMMIPGSLAIITASLAPNRRGKGIGTWSAVTTLVTVAGPILGGFLSDLGLWRAVFLINLPIGIAALIVLVLKVPESRNLRVEGKIDWTGTLLVALGLGSLTYGFISAPDQGFGTPQVWGPLLFGFVALVVFVWVEAHIAHPMMPLKLFRSRTFLGTNLLTLFLYGALSISTFFLSLNLVQIQGFSKTEAGFAFLPFVIILTILSRWAGGLVDQRGPRLPLILGPSLTGLGFFWMSFAGVTPGPSAYWTAFLPGVALMGVGMGFTVAPLSASVMGAVPSQFSGTASGINNAVSRTAGVLAIAIMGALALILFAGSLQAKTGSLNLAPQAKSDLQQEARNLAGAQVPTGMGAGQAAQVRAAIQQSFADTFRVLMWICAALAWISALAAAVWVEPDFTARA